jgi:hypothetical protein
MLTNWMQMELANCKWTKILVVRRLTYSALKRCPLDVPELARLLPQKLQTTLHSTATVTQHQSIIALACHLVQCTQRRRLPLLLSCWIQILYKKICRQFRFWSLFVA